VGLSIRKSIGPGRGLPRRTEHVVFWAIWNGSSGEVDLAIPKEAVTMSEDDIRKEKTNILIVW
jgi:hypothetical protein